MGSGVWELVLKPLMSFLGNVIMNFLVNQSMNFSNEIYQTISMRSLDIFQAKTYTLIFFFLGFSMPVMSLTLYEIGNKYFRKKEKQLDSELDNDVRDQGWFLKKRGKFNKLVFFHF